MKSALQSIFQVGHLERVPLGTPYPGIVAHVGRLLGKLPARTELVIDITGVGKPIFEMFTYSRISPAGVLITAGMSETWDDAIHGVPKLTLVSRLQALLHQGRLKIHRELAEAETLVRELQDFRVEFTAAGHLTFKLETGLRNVLIVDDEVIEHSHHRALGEYRGFFVDRHARRAVGRVHPEGPARLLPKCRVSREQSRHHNACARYLLHLTLPDRVAASRF